MDKLAIHIQYATIEYMNTKKIYKKVSVVILASFVIALVAVVVQKAQVYIAKGIKDSQQLRVAERNVCDSTKGQTPHFGGCSSII